MSNVPAVNITLMYSPAARVVHERAMSLSAGVTVMHALQDSGLLTDCPEIDLAQPEAFTVCIWGKKTTPHHVLRDLDRIEIVRPLTVDPKVARRERFQTQGTSRAGLFSKRRAGAKSGY
ncbi:RnfH family protein [Limnohabitans sp.]|uniref:RnfH family protein n=1 Tax=Limnohabitans sp. TaxID=1907725 RepID=UPI00286F84FF|nr:RnfH family protein [Limnohabitans sp.]